MTKSLILVAIIATLTAGEDSAVAVRAGTKYDQARTVLVALGYKETGLEMVPNDQNRNIMFLGNDKHVLIIQTNKTNSEIVTMALYISDNKPKANRFDRQYGIESILVEGGKLKLVILADG